MNTLNKPLRSLAALTLVAGSAGLQAAVIDCQINSSALAFPVYDASLTGPTDGVGSVDVQCTNLDTTTGATVVVALGLSAGANGSVGDRKMAGNGNLLSYGVYSDAARTSIWGQGMQAVQQSSGLLAPSSARALHFTLFGRIPAQQNVPAGTYQDQLFVTVTP